MMSPDAWVRSTIPVRLNAKVVSMRDCACCHSRSRSRVSPRCAEVLLGASIVSASAATTRTDDGMLRILLGAARQLCRRPQELELLVERVIQLVVEEPARRVLRERGLALRDRVVDYLQVRFNDRRGPRI